MKSVSQKIFTITSLITLTVLSVMPIYATAASSTTPVDMLNGITSVASAIPGTFAINAALYLVMVFIAALLGFTGLILDYVINISVINLAGSINNIAAINETWTVIRDLANMTFIFLLLYEGIKMVLGLGGNIKKVITGIITAAILVNFSLFFTKVVIDASNIVTLGFYRSIVAAGTGATGINFGLSGAFMSVLNLSSIFSFKGALNTIFGNTAGMFAVFGNIVFMLVAAFVFLSITVLFITRYLAFIILLVLSPFYFLSMAIPGLTDLKNMYTKTLTSQALFAPVFMLLTWVMLSVAGDVNFLKTIDSTFMDALMNPGATTIDIIVKYILIIGLLIQTLILSKKIATSGGLVTKEWVNKGQSYIGGAIFGGASIAGRSTIGRWGQSVSEDKDLKERASKGDLGARFKLLAGNKLATSSFDARNTSTVGAITKQTGTFGKAINTKGYRGYVVDKLKAQTEEDKKRAEQFKVSDDKEPLAAYEKLLKDDPSVETNKRDARKAELDVLIAEESYRVQGETKKIQKNIDKLILEKTKYETSKKDLETSLNETKQKILAATQVGDYTTAEIEQATLRTTEEKLAKVTSELNKNITLIQEQKANLTEVKKNLTTLQLEAKEITDDIWISPEYEKLIADAGGRKEEKNNSKEIIKKAVSSTSNKNILAYAERLKNKTGFWSGFPDIRIDTAYSKQRASAIRKLTNQEDTSKKLEKMMRELAKEQEKEEKEASNQTQTPPATPTPPPTTP